MSINSFQDEIGVRFNNQSLLKEALTHRSYLNEDPDWKIPHNERLEFLGDAVLELAVTRYLFSKYPKSEEGELTLMRAALVNTKILASISEEIGLREHLLVSKGESVSVPKAMETILADGFEALLGAIYLDRGFEEAERFVGERVISHIEDVKKKGIKDPKSELQEESQARFKVTPIYQILDEKGPEHDKTFRAGAYIEDRMIAEGTGTSKQEAETDAAKRALEIIAVENK